MYEDILRILDLELDKLKRARHVLTDTEVPSALPEEEESPLPLITELVAVVTVPPVRRRAFARRTRQTVAQPAALADALGGVIPSRPVFVSAAAVKAQATRVEHPVVRTKPVAPTEGTLDSLIRDLRRLSPSDRSSMPS